MDFLTTARLLMDLQTKDPDLYYKFEDGILKIEIYVAPEVPAMFDQAAQMFAPID